MPELVPDTVDLFLLSLLASAVAVPALYVALGTALGQRLNDLGAAIPISMALAAASLVLALVARSAELADGSLAALVAVVGLVLILFPLVGALLFRDKQPPDEISEDPQDTADDGETIEIGDTTPGFNCVPTIVKKIGDKNVSKNPDQGKGYKYNPGLKNILPTTVYAYRWTVTFTSTSTSFGAVADLVGYIHPWYKFGLGKYQGPFRARSTGSAAIVCSKSGDKCVAMSINTKPDTTVKSEYSSGVVVSSKASGDSVTVEGSAVIALKGNVAISGATAGATLGSANVGITLTVPNTALDTETYNQSILYTCKKVTTPSA